MLTTEMEKKERSTFGRETSCFSKREKTELAKQPDRDK